MNSSRVRLPADHYLWLILGVLLAQLALVSVAFPITQLITQTPLFYIDSPFHWYQIEMAKGLASTWRLLGYDPYFSAGYVGGVNFNASAKLPAALCTILSPWLSSIVTYKIYCFVSAIIAPPCVPLAARWLRLPRTAALFAAILAILLWWLSSLRWFQTAGMVSFVLASYLALPYAAYVIRYLSEPTPWHAIFLLALAGAAGMFLHPLYPLLVAPLVIALSLSLWRSIDPRRFIAACTVLPMLCVLPNLLWILPTLKYPGFANGDLSPYQKSVDISIVWNEALGRITGDARGSRLNAVIWFGVLWTAAPRLETRVRRIATAITLICVGFIVFAAIGAALPVVGTLQPNRFSSAAYLYLCIPASIGAGAVLDSLSSQGLRRAAGAASAGFLLTALVFFCRELAREVSYADIPHHGERPPEVRGIGDSSAWILSWLEKNTNANARVLFETSAARVHDEAHMAGYYALTSNREFIGGPYPYMHFAGFWDGQLFGRPIEVFRQDDFAEYLKLYNIGWIIVFSDASKRYLDHIAGVSPLDSFGPFRTYVVLGTHTFFLEGSGKVTAQSFNHIELSELAGASVVLKYHYVAGLQSRPPAKIEPLRMPGDPDPFIRIVDPPSHLILEMQ
jgi:hypothetical protein